MNSNGKTIASMTSGIISTSLSVLSIVLSFFWLIFGITISIISIICGVIAITFSNHSLHSGKAIAGLVTGVVGSSIGSIVFITCLILNLVFTFPLY